MRTMREIALASGADPVRTVIGGPSECPEEELLMAYVAGKADSIDREIVETHVEGCEVCQAALRDIRAFDAELKQADWSFTGGQVAEAAVRTRVSPFRSWGLGWALAFGAASAAVAYWAASARYQGEIVALRSEVERYEASRDELSSRVAGLERSLRDMTDLRVQNAQLNSRLAVLEKQLSQEASLPAPAIVASVFDAGGTVTLDSAGRIGGLELGDPSLRKAVASAMKTGKPRIPRDVLGLRGSAGVLMGPASGAGFGLDSPFATAVREPSPTLSWRKHPDAGGYSVTVVDDDADVNAIANVPVSGTSWSVVPPLTRGKVYRWYVVAKLRDGREVHAPGPADPTARFYVLTAGENAKCADLLRRVKGSDLAQGVAYASLGLLDDAGSQFQRLVRENPGSVLARRLLESVSKRTR
jgi:hypothetical protein